MRIIVKPPAPPLQDTSYGEMARALGITVGRYCSFCEKALTYQLLLFHKQHGIVDVNAQLGLNDWPDLLLACGDCLDSVTAFAPGQQSYFWPDSAAATEVPFLYVPVDNIPVTALAPDGGVSGTTTMSAVLVMISTDVSTQLQQDAARTASLFRLNGRFFNNNVQAPGFTWPYSEFVHPTDYRIQQRGDVYTRATEAARALARALPIREMSEAFPRNEVAMIQGAIKGFGFFSTWQAAIATTLNSIDVKLLPALVSLLSGKPPDSSPRRKRNFSDMEDGITKAPKVVETKRRKLQEVLVNLIKTEG